MKDIITPEESKKIEEYINQNHDKTVGEIMKKFKITKELSFTLVCKTVREKKSLCCSAPIDERGFCQDCKEHA